MLPEIESLQGIPELIPVLVGLGCGWTGGYFLTRTELSAKSLFFIGGIMMSLVILLKYLFHAGYVTGNRLEDFVMAVIFWGGFVPWWVARRRGYALWYLRR